MSKQSWVSKLFGRRPTPRRVAGVRRRGRVRLERLEDRATPAVVFVDDSNVSGVENGSAGNPFNTIQEGVNFAAFGDTVQVAAGTYAEQVTVDKPLLLAGARFGIDARNAIRTGLPDTESVVTGLAGSTSFNVVASDVFIDGFTVQGNTDAVNFGAGIRLAPGTSGSEIRNNIIQTNIAGILLANSNAFNPTFIERNLFLNNTGAGPFSGSAIYSDATVSGGVLSNVTIQDNTFTGNVGTNAAISLLNTGAGSQANVIMTRNVFTGNSQALAAMNLFNAMFTYSEVTGSTLAGGADLQLFNGVVNFVATNNLMAGGAGLAVSVGDAGAPGGDASNILLEFNSFSGYAGGLTVAAGSYAGRLDAEYNFWGAPTGPTHPANPGGTGLAIVDPDGVVDFIPFLVDGTDTFTGTVGFQPSWVDVSVVKGDSPDPVAPGGLLTYTITVGNFGSTAAQTVTLSDTIPAGTTFVSFSAPAGWTTTAPAAGASGTVTATIPTLAAGVPLQTFTLVVRVDQTVAPDSTITNVATVTTTSNDFDLSDNQHTITTGVTGTPPGNGNVDLSVVKTDAPDPVVAGALVTYTATVTNAGPADAQNLLFTDPVPPGATFVSFTAPAGWTVSAPPVGGTGLVSATFPTLTVAAGPQVFTFVVRANSNLPDGATLNNIAAVSSRNFDTNLNNNSDSEITSVVASADVSVLATGLPASVAPGGNMTYTITVANAGPSDATNVTLSNPLPTGTTFVSIAGSPGWSLSLPTVGSTGTLTATIPSLAAGTTQVFTLVVGVPVGTAGGTTLTNTTTVSAPTTDADATNNTATVTTLVDGGGGVAGATVGVSLRTAAGAGPGGGPHVKVFNPDGSLALSFFAYDPSFTGGVRVATADLTGDGIEDLITAPGPGIAPLVNVFNGLDGSLVTSFAAYSGLFTGGVYVAAADVTGDGVTDIITGAGAGGGPHVQVFDGTTFAVVRSFFAYDPSFTGGVRVAGGYVSDDAFADIVTGAGANGGPHVQVFDGQNGATLQSFFAYDPTFTGGIYVAAGDLDGDGRADIITGAGENGGPHVRSFDGVTGAVELSLFAYDPGFLGGVRVTTADVDGDGLVDVVTAPGSGTPTLNRFKGTTGAQLSTSLAFDPAFTSGVFVG